MINYLRGNAMLTALAGVARSLLARNNGSLGETLPTCRAFWIRVKAGRRIKTGPGLMGEPAQAPAMLNGI